MFFNHRLSLWLLVIISSVTISVQLPAFSGAGQPQQALQIHGLALSGSATEVSISETEAKTPEDAYENASQTTTKSDSTSAETKSKEACPKDKISIYLSVYRPVLNYDLIDADQSIARMRRRGLPRSKHPQEMYGGKTRCKSTTREPLLTVDILSNQDNEKKDCLCWLRFQVTGTPRVVNLADFGMMGFRAGVDAASASGVPESGGRDVRGQGYLFLICLIL